jgi:hypothetical protein
MKPQMIWIAAGGAGALAIAYYAGTQNPPRPSHVYPQPSGYSDSGVPAKAGAPAAAGDELLGQGTEQAAAAVPGAAAPNAAAAGGDLDEAIVRRYIEQHLSSSQRITAWGTVKIGAPMRSDGSGGLPVGALIWPTEAVYTSANTEGVSYTRDKREGYYFYRNPATGEWAATVASVVGSGNAY